MSLGQLTAAPPRVTRRRSQHHYTPSVPIPNPVPTSTLTPGPVNACHNLHNCLPVPVRGIVRVERHSTHNLRDVRPHDRHSHQATHSHPVRAQSPLGSSSSLGPSPTPWVLGMSEDESKTIPYALNERLLRNLYVPRSRSHLKAQPVHQVSDADEGVGANVRK